MATPCLLTSWFVYFAFLVYFSHVSPLNATSQDALISKKFQEFIVKYKKTYTNETKEYTRRFENFKESIRRHEILNKLGTNETESALYGVNKFSDLSPKEFKEQYLSNSIPSKVLLTSSYHSYNRHRVFPDGRGASLKNIPLKVDWRTKNVVSPVRNQKSCGGCWAFSTVETIESRYAMKTKTPPPVLSVQQVIDCAVYGNYGCKGGGICSAMMWMNISSVKLVKDSSYPLTDTSDYCKMVPPGLVGLKDYQCKSFMGKGEYGLLEALTHGPVAASVDARTWNDYLGGIIKYHCSQHNNHAIQIVGYDLTGRIPYYIIRNSWGTDFGNDGYIYVKYGDNMCGIGEQVGIPIV